MSEAFDVADRGRFYDGPAPSGTCMQNHMLQVLATVLADPPSTHSIFPAGGTPSIRW